jgi:cephalosporin-C deacetylase-like acetyl esterase
MIHPDYPSPHEIDAWCEELLARSAARDYTAKFIDSDIWNIDRLVYNTGPMQYIRFETEERTFYGVWQPAPSGPAPVVFHVPGYAAEIMGHPVVVEEGFNVLSINPLGYQTPDGPIDPERNWQVMPDTVSTLGMGGYADWLSDACVAVRWALDRPEVIASRFGFFGASQGGGTSCLLASIHRDLGVRAVAADVPYLTGYPRMIDQTEKGAYNAAFNAFSTPEGTPDEWRTLGFIDTIAHAQRLSMPTLLTAGSLDEVTPPHTIEALFNALPGTRSYTYIEGQDHGYTRAMLHLATTWFRLYV